MTTTTWKITQLERDASTGGIMCAWYSVVVTVGDAWRAHSGLVALVPEVSEESHIPYENLTEEDVVSWVKASLGSTYVDSLISALEDDATTNRTPQTAFGLPWA